MGLDTTHNCWHGSYGGFSRWRAEIAKAAGWELDGTGSYVIPDEKIPDQPPLDDETVTEDGETYTIKWSEAYDNSVWLGHWDTDPADVLDVLMVHSDCEGVIPHRFTGPLADRLYALVPATRESSQFINGLRQAHLLGQDVGFH